MRKRSHILNDTGMTKRSHIHTDTVLATGGTHLSCVSLQSVRDWMASRRSSAGISSVGRTTRRISYRVKSVIGMQDTKIYYFKYIFGGLKGVGHSFAYVAHFEFLRDVWIRTQRAAEASSRANNLATHLPRLSTHHTPCSALHTPC
jgi:hypothetical protein